MRKYKIGRILLACLLICNMIALGGMSYVGYSQSGFIAMLENKIDILAQRNEELIYSLEKTLLIVMESVVGLGDKAFDIEKTINKMLEYRKLLEKSIESKKDIDLDNVKGIKEANVLIKNLTKGCLGSGTHIKINDESYVLTCAHLVEGDLKDNLLVIVSDRGTWSKAEIVKYNKTKDLMLLKVPQLKNNYYLKISDKAPKVGSEVIVIGNPAGIIDMITNGIITQVNSKGYYLITNKIWFGNSGCSLLYKGELVGVISQILAFSSVNPFGRVVAQNYGKVVGLGEIKTFLKESNYESTE